MKESKEAGKTCFIDSNIWLYSFIEAQDIQKSNMAKSLIRSKNSTIIVSTQIINEICVNLIRKTSLSEEKIRNLTVSFYTKYNVVEINKEVIIKASQIREKHSSSFWDSIVCASALYAKAEIIYSEDMQDGFVIENTRIVNPLK